MNNYAVMLESDLKEAGFQFRSMQTQNGSQFFINSLPTKNRVPVFVYDYVIEIDESSCRFMRHLYEVSPEKMDDALLYANRLNNASLYAGFCVLPGNPAAFCALYYFSISGIPEKVSSQILMMFALFHKSISETIGR